METGAMQFRELQFSIETTDSERIAVDYVSKSTSEDSRES
jgi:hypothetical protein